MSSIKHKLEEIAYYSSLINPLIPKKYRICRSFAREAHKYYDFLEESQWWPKEKLKEYQSEKLKKLIRYAFEKAPYYNNLFMYKQKTAYEIRSIEDIKKLPILNKDIIRKHSKKILSSEISDRKACLARTGASTGEPLVFYLDKKANDLAWAAFFRFLCWTGYRWGDKIALFWRTPEELKKHGKWYQNIADWLKASYVINLKHFDAFKMSENHFANYAAELQQYQPDIIRGYPSAIIYFTNYCIENNIKGIQPKAITTTAEPLFKREQKLLKNYYKCKVFDHYGCGEVYSVAFECEKHSGLHITAEHVIVEIIDDYGNSLNDGQEGRVILTDLDNLMMPFIRYENGDIGSFRKGSCACGRTLPLMNHVNGRVFGLIRGVNGNVVHGEFFADLLQDLGWYEAYDLTHFEVVQKTIGGFDCNFVCSSIPDKKAIEGFVDSCCKYFGNMKISVNFADHILTTPAGKRRNKRSEIDPIRTQT